MKFRSIFASLLLSASMMGGAAAAEPVKLTGEELKQWLADGYVLAGYSIRNFGNTFILKQYPTGEAFLDWRGGTDMGGTWRTIEVEVKGDEICRTFDNLALLCGSVYKLEGNTYVGVNQNGELSSVYVKLPKYDDMLKMAETVAPAVPGSN